MTMKNDVKIDEELTCRSKLKWGMKQLFDRNTQKSQKFAF